VTAAASPAGAIPAWEELVSLLVPAGSLTELTWYPHDVGVRADLYRQLLMNVALGYFLYFQSDPDHPDWTPFLNSVFLLQPNPDDTYYLAQVRGSGVYRISGERGSVHLLTFATGARMMGMSATPGQGYEQYDADELTVAADGSFEVIMSHERPAGVRGNWWHLDPRADYILVRQRSYDWGRERDARLAIERIDCPNLKPRLTPEEITAKIQELLAGFAPRLTTMWLHFQNAMRSRDVVNRFEFADFGSIGAVRIQHYWQCIFELEPGEALILETELPARCRYWNVQLNDPLFNAVEYVYRQSSLNGHQAHIDADGRFRAVLALEDPGVANWLDSGGYTRGTVMGRWYGADSQPLPTMTRVSVSDLHQHLPAGTLQVSAQERERRLRARARGAQLRRRW
jgi:hypothetical protein